MNRADYKRFLIVLAVLALLAGLLVGAAWLLGDRLRDYLVVRVNKGLKGYHVSARDLSVHPLSLSFVFNDLRMIQQQHPEPPVIEIPAVTVSISFKALIRGRVATVIHLQDPHVTLDLNHVRTEIKDDVPLKNKGLQHTRRISPFIIDQLDVEGGRIAYTGRGESQPLTVTHVRLTAGNIRNIQNPDDPYPSPIAASAHVFGDGKIELQGRANFLARPSPSVKGSVTVEKISLERLAPIASQTRLSVESGVIEIFKARIEYAESNKQLDVSEAIFRDLKGNFVYPVKKSKIVGKAISKAKEVTAKKKVQPGQLRIRVEKLSLIDGNLGVVNLETDPNYRVFISKIKSEVENYSNGFENGPARVRLRGQFMGSGNTVVYGTFRPELHGPDFDLRVAVENTRIADMNPLLKAYAGLDAAAGLFSVYSEVSAHNRQISGYVKPLIQNLKVYSPQQDENENLFKQIYEGVADVLAKLLENRPRNDVATETDLSGNLDNPRASTVETLVNLVRNAFFKAILPGFQKQGA